MQRFCWKKTRKTYDDGFGAAVVHYWSTWISTWRVWPFAKAKTSKAKIPTIQFYWVVIRRQRQTYLFHRTRVYVNLRGKLHLVSFEEIRGNCKTQASRGKECAKRGRPRYFATWNEAINGFRSIMMSKNQTLLFKKGTHTYEHQPISTFVVYLSITPRLSFNWSWNWNAYFFLLFVW